MAHEHHTWRVGADPPTIRPHSLAKHRVLGSYLRRYVEVLTANPRQDLFKLTLVDGFSGGGAYLDERTREERPGSPLIMLEAMAEALARARAWRSKKPFHLDVRYIFVEKSREALAYLRDRIEKSEHRRLLNGNIDFLEGEFLTHSATIVDQIERRGRSPRAIFFLDQFGYANVPMPALRSTLKRLPNAEIILTFATDFLIDYLNESEQSRKTWDKIGIPFPAKIEKHHRDWRRFIQQHLHSQIPSETEAKYYTPFFIRSTDSHRDFWLIHLSGHHRARDVMVGLHWSENTSFAHYGGSGLRMLGYDPAEDFNSTQQKMLPGFYFDETARAASYEQLLDQLPERLARQSCPKPFVQLFAEITNETPATSGLIKEVLADLAREGIIRVRDKSGATARRAGIQRETDLIIVSKQTRFI